VIRSATMYCHVLVDCEYMLWMIGGVLRADPGESEGGVDADIIYGGSLEAAVSILLDKSDVASGKPSRHSRFQCKDEMSRRWPTNGSGSPTEECRS
jgi:hypothetical protein